MNKQIKKLAEHAGGTYKQNLGVWQFYEYELQEFANLIIQECAEMPLSEAIKKKFGVENEQQGKATV